MADRKAQAARWKSMLVVEIYDFSSVAQDLLGRDVADRDTYLLQLLARRFKTYSGIRAWLEANGIPFEVSIDDWA